MEPVTKRIAHEVTIGNHEYDHIGVGGKDPSGAKPGGWHPQNEGEAWEIWGMILKVSVVCLRMLDILERGMAMEYFGTVSTKVASIQLCCQRTRLADRSRQYLWLENDLNP